MADSLWITQPGQGWEFGDYLITDKNLLFDFLWNTMRDASKERIATGEFTDETNFPTSDKFPDLSDLKVLFNNSGSAPNRVANRMTNSLLPANTMKTSDFTPGNPANIPEILSVGNLLTGPLGYPSGTPLWEQAVAGNSDGAVFTSWTKQMFELMEYVFYCEREFRTNGNTPNWILTIEIQDISVRTEYRHTATSFTNCTCNVIQPTFASPPVDIYQPGDLNEVSPFSSIQDVMDYTASQFLTQRDLATWNAGLTNAVSRPLQLRHSAIWRGFFPSTSELKQCEISQRRVRFKIDQEYRADGTRYDTPFYWYFNNDGPFSDTYGDFGTGWPEGVSQLIQFTKHTDDYYYVGIDGQLGTPDFTTIPTPPFLPTGGASQQIGSEQFSLTDGMGSVTNRQHGFYLAPNQTNGLSWLHYTPAP